MLFGQSPPRGANITAMGKKALHKLRDAVVRTKDRSRASSAACAADLAERASEDGHGEPASRRSSLGSLTASAAAAWQPPQQAQPQPQPQPPKKPRKSSFLHDVLGL